METQSFKRIYALLTFSFTLMIGWSQDVKVQVNFGINRMYENVGELDRARFLNIHEPPFGVDFTVEERAKLDNLGVNYGRAFMGPSCGSVVAAGDTSVGILMKQADQLRKVINSDKNLDKRQLEKLILTAHPTPGKNSNKYAFHWKGLNSDYTEEGNYAVKYYHTYFGMPDEIKIPMPVYFEPMNEPFVHSWDYKGVRGEDIRIEMAQYHKQVAAILHKNIKGLMIGGPTEAWPSYELKNSDFTLWNDQMKPT